MGKTPIQISVRLLNSENSNKIPQLLIFSYHARQKIRIVYWRTERFVPFEPPLETCRRRLARCISNLGFVARFPDNGRVDSMPHRTRLRKAQIGYWLRVHSGFPNTNRSEHREEGQRLRKYNKNRTFWRKLSTQNDVGNVFKVKLDFLI